MFSHFSSSSYNHYLDVLPRSPVLSSASYSTTIVLSFFATMSEFIDFVNGLSIMSCTIYAHTYQNSSFNKVSILISKPCQLFSCCFLLYFKIRSRFKKRNDNKQMRSMRWPRRVFKNCNFLDKKHKCVITEMYWHKLQTV